MTTAKRLLELRAASVAAWDARLAAEAAYNDAAGRTADDALAAAWADYLLAADAHHKADAAYWDTYRADLNSAWDAEEDLDQ